MKDVTGIHTQIYDSKVISSDAQLRYKLYFDHLTFFLRFIERRFTAENCVKLKYNSITWYYSLVDVYLEAQFGPKNWTFQCLKFEKLAYIPKVLLCDISKYLIVEHVHSIFYNDNKIITYALRWIQNTPIWKLRSPFFG